MKLLSLATNTRFKLVLSVSVFVLFVPVVAQAGVLDLGVMVLSLFARLTGWAGILLNLSIMELVFNMGKILTSNIGESVENSWSIIRDLMNLLFIFSLIYIGFQTILDFGNPRPLLAKLIVAALLINFSLFFTKFIVDISNVAAVEIYTTVGFVPQNLINNPDPKLAEDALVNIGVSGAYMQAMGLKDLISPQNNQTNNAGLSYVEHLEHECKDNNDASDCNVTLLVYFFASIIFFLVATYAFAVGAFMLVTRFVILVILMILSPLMFVGMIFPKASKHQERWWGTFLNSAFFAPAYILLLYIGYAVATKVNVFSNTNTDGSPKGMFNAVAGQYAAVDLILNFAIVVAFLLMAAWLGKEMSFHGSKATLNLADNLRRRGQRLLAAGTLGTGAWVMRNTVGARAYKTVNAENEKGRSLALKAQGTGIGAWTARQRLALAKKQSEASYDPRQLMSKKAQDQVGTGQKGGYAQSIADRQKAEEARVKIYGQNDSQVYADYGVEAQYEKYKDLNDTASRLRKEIATSSNAAEREAKTKELQTIIGKIKAMEKGEALDLKTVEGEFSGTYQQYKEKQRAAGKAVMPENSFNLSKNRLVKEAERQNAPKIMQAKLFAEAKKQETGYGARQYAENLKNRYTGNEASRIFGWFYDDPIARKAAAKEIIKKNSSKSSGQRIEDIVRELQEKGGGGSTTT